MIIYEYCILIVYFIWLFMNTAYFLYILLHYSWILYSYCIFYLTIHEYCILIVYFIWLFMNTVDDKDWTWTTMLMILIQLDVETWKLCVLLLHLSLLCIISIFSQQQVVHVIGVVVKPPRTFAGACVPASSWGCVGGLHIEY